MAQPVKLLTRLHVHALNPVDGMRAFMDEGNLYFDSFRRLVLGQVNKTKNL